MAELKASSERRDPPLAQLLASAAQILQGITQGRSQSDQLRQVPVNLKAASQSISSSALRRWGLVQALRQIMLERAPRIEIEMLLDVGLSELIAHDEGQSQRSVHTLVDQTVAAVDWLLPQSGPAARKSARGLVNAVLRRYMREGAQLLLQAREQALARDNLPDWWTAQLHQLYGVDAPALIERGKSAAPMTLRVNLARASLAQVSAALHSAGIAHQALGDAAIRLQQPRPVESLPGFAEGRLSVQDLGAQLSAHLLLEHMHAENPPSQQAQQQQPIWRVLDACAAPGGKTGHLLEHLGLKQIRAHVLALDSDALRIARVHENLQRLGWTQAEQPVAGTQVSVRAMVGDAALLGQVSGVAAGGKFNSILLDAPCTAAGIVSRHPDIPWLRRRGDIATLVRQQQRLLDALWPQLVEGGTLLYVTCSLFYDENEGQMRDFASRHPDCLRMPTPVPQPFQGQLKVSATGGGVGLQLLPTSGEQTHDGFFYALLRKRAGAA